MKGDPLQNICVLTATSTARTPTKCSVICCKNTTLQAHNVSLLYAHIKQQRSKNKMHTLTKLVAQQHNVAITQQNTSKHAQSARFAVIHAAQQNAKNIAKLNAQQLAQANMLYVQVCNAYNSAVYKNIRANCVTIKVANTHSVIIANLHILMQYCSTNNIVVQNNVNTASVSYVLAF